MRVRDRASPYLSRARAQRHVRDGDDRQGVLVLLVEVPDPGIVPRHSPNVREPQVRQLPRKSRHEVVRPWKDIGRHQVGDDPRDFGPGSRREVDGVEERLQLPDGKEGPAQFFKLSVSLEARIDERPIHADRFPHDLQGPPDPREGDAVLTSDGRKDERLNEVGEREEARGALVNVDERRRVPRLPLGRVRLARNPVRKRCHRQLRKMRRLGDGVRRHLSRVLPAVDVLGALGHVLSAYGEILPGRTAIDRSMFVELTGYAVLEWMHEHDRWVADISIHTLNDLGALDMMVKLRSFAPPRVEFRRVCPEEP